MPNKVKDAILGLVVVIFLMSFGAISSDLMKVQEQTPKYQKVIKLEPWEDDFDKNLSPWLKKGYIIKEIATANNITVIYLVKY